MALTDGLVSYYKCDDNGTFPDAHGSNDGTISGATFTASGKIGGAYSFDGNDYVNFNSPFNYDIVSIQAWVKLNSVAGTAEQGIVDNVQSAGYGLFYSSDLNNNKKWQFLVRVGASYYYVSSNDLATTNWTHLVGTYDGSQIQLYVNGVLQTEVTSISGSIVDSPVNMYAGTNAPGGVNYLTGIIDEVGLWNKALSLSEVQELYNSGSGLQYPFTGGGGGAPPSNSVFVGCNF